MTVPVLSLSLEPWAWLVTPSNLALIALPGSARGGAVSSHVPVLGTAGVGSLKGLSTESGGAHMGQSLARDTLTCLESPQLAGATSLTLWSDPVGVVTGFLWLIGQNSREEKAKETVAEAAGGGRAWPRDPETEQQHVGKPTRWAALRCVDCALPLGDACRPRLHAVLPGRFRLVVWGLGRGLHKDSLYSSPRAGSVCSSF